MISGGAAGSDSSVRGHRSQVQVTVDDPGVGVDPTALRDHQYITGHQRADLDLDRLTVPHDAGKALSTSST